MGCRTRTKCSTTSKHAPKHKLNAANAVVVDLHAAVAHVGGLIYLRNNLRRADAFVSSAEERIERSWVCGGDEGGDSNGDDDGGVLRSRNQVEYLVEATKLSVRAEIRTGEGLDVERSRHRTGLHEHRART